MARSFVPRTVYTKDKDTLRELVQYYQFRLMICVTHVQLPIELVLKLITRHALHTCFDSMDDYENFMSRLKMMHRYATEMTQFMRDVSNLLRIEIYAPFTEAKWVEYFLDLKSGLRWRMALIRHLVSCYSVPHLSLPSLADVTQFARLIQEIEVLPITLLNELACLERHLDEDFVEAYFLDPTLER